MQTLTVRASGAAESDDEVPEQKETTTPMASKKTTTRATPKSWPGKPSLASFIRGLGLDLKPAEALAKALAAGYEGATVKNVYVAQSELRSGKIVGTKRGRRGPRKKAARRLGPPRAAGPGLVRVGYPSRLKARVLAPLGDIEREFVAIAVRIGPERCGDLMQRVASVYRSLGI